jgi:hypothetical protein
VTGAATVEALTRPAAAPDSAAWGSWLQDRIEPGWRPGEWDATNWLFTGNPDNPATLVVRCRTVSCPAVLPGRTVRFCEACQHDLAERDQSEPDFAATHVPAGRHCSPGGARGACLVTRAGTDCARPRFARNLCLSHYLGWQAHRRRTEPEGQDLELPEWVRLFATPYPDPPPECLVVACLGSACSRRGLCNYHLRLWWNAGKIGQAGTPRQWAAGQIPYLAGYQFSLMPLSELLRWEVLFALQHREEPGRSLNPNVVRLAVTELARTSVTTLLADPPALHSVPRRPKDVSGQLKNLCWAIRLGFDEFSGVKPTDKTVLDLRAVGLTREHDNGRRRRATGTADLGVLEQLWLRRLVQRWVEIEHPPARTFNQTLRAVRIASRALTQRPGGGHDPTALRHTDMSAVVAALWSQTKPEGTAYSANTGANWRAVWFKVLDFGGRAGLLDELAPSFVRDRGSHPNPHRHCGRNTEDEVGKAVPESVIAQLDTHLDILGTGGVYGYGTALIAAEDLRAMYQTVYVLLRDTGRRPTEIATLPRDCLEHHRGEVSLIWDNRKARRLRRRLPITADTAQTIRAWRARRDQLAVPARGEKFLFPALTRASPDPHLPSSAISGAIRIWADGVPELLSEDLDAAGNRMPFDPSRIYPYAFRHSYAQRHADAGTPTDVLRELMDHRSIETTAGYYTVSMKRRRHAVAALSAHVVDRHGSPAACTSSAYQTRSVAVPYGGCTEPSNIKAGGRACPIRFQCAGCGFYRPDPSYLTAIEQHINELRAGRETARAMDAATFVLTAMTEEINAYDAVAATMRTRLAELPTEERAEIEHASTVLRKIRAASGGPTALPLTVINRRPATAPTDAG